MNSNKLVSFNFVYPKAKIIWQTGSLNRSSEEFADSIKAHGKKKTWDFNVGKDNWSLLFPSSIGGEKPYKRPEAVNIKFKITHAGTYTLVLALTDAKNLLNTFEVYLDGKKTGEYTVAGNNPRGDNDTQARFAQIMKLNQGNHSITLRYKNPKSKYYWIAFDAIALLQGACRPVYQAHEFDRSSGEVKHRIWCEPMVKRPDVKKAMGFGSLEGTDFDIIFNLPNGKYEFELGFSESVDLNGESLFSKAGMRSFDTYINGQKVLENYDILQKFPERRMGVERFPVNVYNKQVVLRLAGKKGLARISRVRILQNNKCIKTYEFIRGQDTKTIKWNPAEHCFESPVNLVPNPGFELVDRNGKLHSWVSTAAPSAAKQVTGNAYTGKASLCLNGNSPGSVRADTMSVVCHDKPYTFTCWIRTTGKCRVRPKLLWYRWEVQYRADQIKRYREAKKRKQIEVAGATHGQWSSSNGNWQKVTLRTIPPRGVNTVSFGFDWEGGNGYVYIDEMFFDGLGALPIELILSQGGYDSKGIKRAIVFSKRDNKCKSGIFILRKASNDIVTRQKLKYIGSYPWKYHDENLTIAESRWNRDVWIADFSKIHKPGRYTLEVVLNNGETQLSPVFAVKDGLYGSLSRYVSNTYFPVIRCGTNVPGWHPPCHTDDADFIDRKGKRIGHKAVFGGWHDAGDMNIFETNTAKCAMSLVYCGGLLKEKKILDEACWGLDHLVRCQAENGAMPHIIMGYPEATPFMRPDKATDGNPKTPDNRIFKGSLDTESYMSAIIGFYNAAGLLDKTNPDKAEKYRNFAKTGMNYLKRHNCLKGYACLPWKVLIALANKEKTTHTEALIKPLLETVRDRSCLGRWPITGRTDFMYLYALLEFAKLNPNHHLTGIINKEVRGFIDEVMVPATTDTPFGQIQELRPNRRRFVENLKYDISYKYSAAVIFAYAAEVFKHQAYIKLAETQIHWGLGCNPANISAIAGIGWRQQSSFNIGATEFVGHENGQYPGATHHSVVPGSGCRNIAKRRISTNTPLYLGHPFDFPICGILVDYPSFPYGGEPYIAHAGPFILACAHLDSAMKSLK